MKSRFITSSSFSAVVFQAEFPVSLRGQEAQSTLTNRADRLEWFRDQGFGLFIHWSVDSQIGSVISHSMVGASDDYLKRYVEDLPKTFNPRKFHPEDWAALARLAGHQIHHVYDQTPFRVLYV